MKLHIIKILMLFLIVLAVTSPRDAVSQATTYTLIISNDILTSPSTYEFDIYQLDAVQQIPGSKVSFESVNNIVKNCCICAKRYRNAGRDSYNQSIWFDRGVKLQLLLMKWNKRVIISQNLTAQIFRAEFISI